MTLAQLEALEERRAIDIRHARFNAALIASTVYNVNRIGDMKALSAFDFLPGYEPDPEEERKREALLATRRGITRAMLDLPKECTREQVLAEKARILAHAKQNNIEGAEDVFREVFPYLEG